MTIPNAYQLKALRLTADGYNAAQVAKKLGTSPNTITFWMGKLREQYHARNTTHLCVMATKEKLI
jgi:DNA-binding CsgD family transcriptional regulator